MKEIFRGRSVETRDKMRNAGSCLAARKPLKTLTFLDVVKSRKKKMSKKAKKLLTKAAVGAKITPIPRMERAPCKLNNETLTSTR